MKIEKIGTWTIEGFAVGWVFSGGGTGMPISSILRIYKNKVFVNDVEIIPWTEERKRIMEA